jgi:Questin oxidase-like
MTEQILNESLARLAATGPEFGGGLSNHGPMAAEALVQLGRADDVESWLDGYIRQLEEAPRAALRITDWREALGQPSRVADWELYFRDRLADEPWRKVLADWWVRLLPGVAAAATHGIIRTSHAARSLASDETPVRTAELAKGLAYWAATYLELPGTAATSGRLDLAAALSKVPVAAAEPASGMITQGLKAGLAAEPGFGSAVSALRPPHDVLADLAALARQFSQIFLCYGYRRPVALVHAVTAPVAARSVLPLLPDDLARPTHDALWNVAAALYMVYAGGVEPRPLPTSAPPDPGVLTDRAVATEDAHAIKLTEACLRLHRETPDPALLHAAGRASELLGQR